MRTDWRYRPRKRFLAALLGLIGALVLTGSVGCGPRKSGAGGAQGAGKASGHNVFRYALQTKPTQLDPATVEDGDTIDLIQQIFEGLVRWDEKNQLVPNIAERWDISPDGRVYTFHLKDNVKFHNGRKLTASDFEYSLTRVLRPETKSPTAKTYLNDIVGALDLYNGKATTLSGVKALDDHTLQITIDKRRPYFLGKLTYPTAFVVCKEAIEKNGGQFDEHAMIGTGPFMLKEYQPDYKVSLVANPDYHNGRPVLDGIERPIIKDNVTRQTEFESNETDLVDVQRADLNRVKKDPILAPELKQFTRAQIWYLALNQQAYAPFKDKRVRQAFAYAIDKDSLIRVVLKDAAQKANGIVPPGIAGYDPNYRGLPYDPKKAQELLAAAGYPGGKGMPPLTISYRNGYDFIKDGVLAMRDDLKRNLGIEVGTREVEWGVFLQDRLHGTMPCYHLRWAADYLDAQDFLSVMLHTGAVENSIGYSNPQFDALCDQADIEPNPEKRAALYHQAEQIAVDDAPWVCLYFFDDLELHQPYVKGIRDSLLGHLPHTTTTVAH